MNTDLQKAWAEVLSKTAQHWIYNCDSGCFAEVCEREAWTTGPYLIIYQPHKSMKEYDDMYASIFIKRTDKQKITKEEWTSANLDHINRLVLESYNEILAHTQNKWSHPIDGSFEQLIQLKKPLELEKGMLKMTFEIRGAVNGCCGDRWWPHKLMQYLGDDGVIDTDEETLCNFTMDAKPHQFD